ncbi:MAG: cbb3-type cytochrome c oxidase subunit I, partial [Alphaproteobacteria bacterium]|nr:cbb3-type cytochrome c oxidase subunit I [Alphaproteobacteria bacterium]
PPGVTARAGLWLAVAGSALLLVPTLGNQGEASLNNYVPVLDHPLYYVGLGMAALGVALALWRPGVFAIDDPGAFGLACAGLGFLAACLCFVIAALSIPAGTDRAHYIERLFWGGGHVLQFVNTAMLMIAWHRLGVAAFGRAPLPPNVTRAVFALLAIAALAAPLIYARHDVLGLAHRHAFTDLLWYALPLPPLIAGLGVARLFLTGPRPDWKSPATLALGLSLAVFFLGGVSGFFLGVADTRTPSHYHAAIGGVNLAMMGLFHVVFLPLLGRRPKPGRVLTLQYHLYGWGQLLHALGFFLAGATGVPRKSTGAEQGLDSVWKIVSMGVVGLGGAIAVLGGVLFVWSALTLLLKREARDA